MVFVKDVIVLNRRNLLETVGLVGLGLVTGKQLFAEFSEKVFPEPPLLEAVPIQKADTPNLNGRIYPKKILEKAVEDFNASRNGIVGQIGMPDPLFVSHIRLSEISHVVRELKLYDCPEDDAKMLTADIQVLGTKQGKLLQSLLKSEHGVAFRLAGTTSLCETKGYMVVQKDYKIHSINSIDPKDSA